jgi:hypothetical protein
LKRRFPRDARFQWRCPRGHIWEARYDSVLNGTSCPHCPREDKENECLAIAEAQGFKMLSPYVNTETPIKWECSVGHEFSRSYNKVKQNGLRCKYCDRVYQTVYSRRSGPSRQRLTLRQKQVLNFFYDSTKRDGYPPSPKEVGIHLGVTGSRGRQIIQALCRRGFLLNTIEQAA